METKAPSPNGKYVFHIFPWEARMSLWVESPVLMDTASGESVLKFENDNWSLNGAEWLDEERVTIWLRRYPGDHSPSAFEVVVDCGRKEAALEGGVVVPLAELEKVLEAAYFRGRLKAAPAALPQAGRTGGVLKRLFGRKVS